jgi:hypothetical protein
MSISAKFASLLGDLFSRGNSCLSIQLALRRMNDACALCVNFGSVMTPRYFVSLVQAAFSLKSLLVEYCDIFAKSYGKQS